MGAQSSTDVEQFVRSLSEINQAVDGGAETAALLRTVVTEAARLVDADSAVVLLFDDDQARVVLSAAHGFSAANDKPVTVRPEGVIGWVIDKGESILLEDTARDGRFVPVVSPARPMRSVIAVPVKVRGRTIGVLCAGYETPGRFNNGHQALLTFLANSTGLALDSARQYRLALTDALTGLHTRQHVAERLREEVDRSHRYGQPLSVLLLDLDRFAAINTAHGRAVGDVVLRTVAERLQCSLREVDLLARHEGESFMAVLPNTNRSGAERVADRMLEEVRRSPVDTAAGPLHVTASVGGAALGAREEARDLLVRADAALFQAKSQGRDRAVFNWLCFASVS